MTVDKKRKIAVLTGNRADYSRIKSVLKSIQNHPALELRLVVIGSHLLEKYGHTAQEIERDGFHIDYRIPMEVAGESLVSMTKSVGLAIVELSTYFSNDRPDLVIVPVDRFESLAMATASALMNLPIAHIQGGEVTGTIDESIRHAITKLAHIHFPATEDARQRIIKMGEPAHLVFNVGCPGSDLLSQAPVWTRQETIARVNEYIKEQDSRLDAQQEYLLIVQHPVTTEFGSGFAQINATLEAVARQGMQGIMLWPNIDAGSDDVARGIRMFMLQHPELRLPVLKHFPNDVFINLMRNTSCLVGNSSSGIREACYFGTPVVNIGSRQSGRERPSNVLDVHHDHQVIDQALRTQRAHGKYEPNFLYGDGTAHQKIADILATLTLENVQKRITY